MLRSRLMMLAAMAAIALMGLILPIWGASTDANSELHSRVTVVDTAGNRISPATAGEAASAASTITSAELSVKGELARATVKYKLINLTASSNVQEVVAAVSAKKIVVIGADLSASTACTVTWYSAAAAISHDMTLAATGGRVWPQSYAGWAKTVAGEALNAKCQTGNCGVLIAYREE